jgi:haloalkane dehalogenase
VKGSNIHYIDEGEGEVFLFLHGNPTSSYLWRNIIPHLSNSARCIAPDMIGMGKSDKPELKYGFTDSYAYIEAFIEALELKNVWLVLHDWGSAMGFHYAQRHPDNVSGLAFMESMLDTFEWEDIPPGVRLQFRMMRTPGIGWAFVNLGNLFIKKMLPDMIKRDLKPEEKAYYAGPYRTFADRTPLRRWPEDVPISGSPKDAYDAVKDYRAWLEETAVPKLFFNASPGVANKEKDLAWVNSLKNAQTVELGEGLHFVQEDHPHKIGSEIARWYKNEKDKT